MCLCSDDRKWMCNSLFRAKTEMSYAGFGIFRNGQECFCRIPYKELSIPPNPLYIQRKGIRKPSLPNALNEVRNRLILAILYLL